MISRRTQLLSIALTAVLFSPVWAQSPIAYWNFDNASNRYDDATGNGNTLTPVGAIAGFPAGISGDGIDLNNGGKVVRSFGSAVTLDEFSISMWATLQGGSNNQFDDYWEIGATGSDGYVLENTGGNDPDAFNVGGLTGASDVNTVTTPDLFDGNFHHLVMTMSATNNEVDLYIDGALNDSSTWSATADLNNLTLGGRYNTGLRSIDGILDDAQIYDYALNANQVDFLFNNPGQTIVPEPASIAIWTLLGMGLCGFGYYRSRRKQ